MDTLNNIISGLKWGKLDPVEAQDRVLSLFSVSQRSELLKFLKWYLDNELDFKEDATIEDYVQQYINFNCG